MRPGDREAASSPGGQGPEERVEAGHRLDRAADHQAVAPLQREHPAAGADVQVVHAAGGQRLGPLDVVAVVRVAAVDHHVPGRHQPGQLLDDPAGDPGRDHHPRRPGGRQLGHQVLQGGGTDRPVALQLLDDRLVVVVDDALLAGAQQPPDEVGAHPSEADHAKLHRAPSPPTMSTHGIR